jgi:hypothetical protein
MAGKVTFFVRSSMLGIIIGGVIALVTQSFF